MAKKKKFWSRPEQLACPSMRSSLPCKAQLQDWKDLNNCSFKICPEAPDFGENKNFITSYYYTI